MIVNMSRDSKNYREGKECPIQKEYDGYAFCYLQPVTNRDGSMVGHPIFKGYSGSPMTFINCNLVNAVPPRGSVIIDSNTTILETEVLKPDSTGDRETVIHGRTDPDTLEPEYKEEPLRVSKRSIINGR